MTNNGETTGSSENGDITGRDGQVGRTGGAPHEELSAKSEHTAYVSHTTYDTNAEYGARPADHQVTLRTPAELADALPYLLGYRPEDSIVLVALHDRDGRGRFGGRARLGIPRNPDDWGAVAHQLAQGLVKGSERRGTRPAHMVAYLCQEPARGETGRQVVERLKSLAHRLRLECGRLEVPVIEALCISDGRFWSYCCAGNGCCPVEGVPMGLPGTSVLAAAATYAGIQVRGTLRELRARLLQLETGPALEQEVALDTAGMTLVPRILDEASRPAVAEETLELARRVMGRFAEASAVSGVLMADHRDDELLGSDEAAVLILGLQDRVTRDRAAQWMEGEQAAPALRLWRALARRCVGPYGEHAAAPLTLAGWVAWSSGDELEAREALAMALGADPEYLFARLLHQACNEGLDPESVRRCLRAEREGHAEHIAAGRPGSAATAGNSEGGPQGTHGTEAPARRHGTKRGDGSADLRCPGAGNRPDDGDHPDHGNCSGEGSRSGAPMDVVGPGEAGDRGRTGEVKGNVGSVPHGPVTRSSKTVSATVPTAPRRRRRVRPTGADTDQAPAVAEAEEGQEPERPARGANGLSAHSPRPRPTRPVAPSGGGSRPRPVGRTSTRRRGNCPEGPPSDSDDTTMKR